MTDDATPRDRAWLAVVDLLANASSMTVRDIANGGNIHLDTARAVLHVAEDDGVLKREGKRTQTYHPNIDPIGWPDDPEHRRAIQSLLADLKQ